MKIGTYYYPEQWPREQWERDFDNIAALGLQMVHMGEFAWFTMEPREGEINLDWLAECIEMAAKRKLSVILCTPTAAPPVWLVEKHPEILPVDDAGRSMRFGGRRHYSPTAPAYHEAARRIVGAMADKFGDHPAIIGWQIDNEYSSDFIDQNDHAVAGWREWLRKKYSAIEALNKAWGCQFWNTYYTDFAQILLPPDRDPKYGNPHHYLDTSRFWSAAFAQFNRIQAEILRAKVGHRFITTNFMPMHPDVSPADMAGDLTLMSWDSYPCPGQEHAPKDQNYRIGDPAQIGFMHDYMKSFHNRWGLMEVQPGQINWGNAPVHLFPGAVRLWLWTAFAHGAEFSTTYRYRQPRFGIELFHHGLVGPDGVTPTLGGREFQQTIDEIKRLDLSTAGVVGAILAGATPAVTAASAAAKTADAASAAAKTAAAHASPAAVAAPSTASSSAPPEKPPAAPIVTAIPAIGLVFDFEQMWWFKILPQSRRWSYEHLIRLWYAAFSRLGCAIKVLRPDQDWPADLPIIVAPALQMVDDSTIDKMTKYAQGGGHLVLTCRTALMDKTGQLFEGPIAKPILSLIGGAIEAYDGLPEGAMGKVDLDGKEFEWGIWGDLLYSEPETKILAKYDDQFYEGAAAVIQHKVNKGLVTYCGVFGEEAFTNALAEKLATQAKVPITLLTPRVQILRRGAYRVLLNYTTATVDAPAPAKTRFVVGARKVEPAGVAVWKE